MRRTGRWLSAAAWLAVSWGLSSSARAQVPPPPPRTEAELAAARTLFAEALRNEEGRRFDAALGGFRRVREVRDTAPVEYRIATCLEGLGHFAEALSAYAAALRLGEGDPAATDVQVASHARIEALSPRVAHLTLVLSARAPSDAEVRVDGKPQRGGDVVLDPGEHRVEGTATGSTPFRSDVALPEGARLSLTVALDPPVAVATPPQPRANEPGAPLAGPADSTVTWGWVAIGAGGALLAASVTSFVLRESDIRAANRDCPGGECVGSIDGGALSATERARVEGPLGVGLGAAGIAVAAIGVYLVVSSHVPARVLALLPTASRDGVGVELGGAL